MAAIDTSSIRSNYFQLRALREAVQREETPAGVAALAAKVYTPQEASRLDLTSRDLSICKNRLDQVIQALMTEALSVQLTQESPESRVLVEMAVDEWERGAPPEEAANRAVAAREIKRFLAERNPFFLILNNMKLTSLPPIFQHPHFVKHLKNLNLGENRLRELPKDICKLNNLGSLHLKNNLLTRLPEEMGQLRLLHSLNIGNNCLTALPEEIGLLKNLRSFDADLNQLTELPSTMAELVDLYDLSLQKNNIEVFPKEILQFKKLTQLDLSENKIENLPPEIGNLEALRFLRIKDNCLLSLPAEMGRLQSECQIDLTHNEIWDPLPIEITQNPNLQIVGLDEQNLWVKPAAASDATHQK